MRGMIPYPSLVYPTTMPLEMTNLACGAIFASGASSSGPLTSQKTTSLPLALGLVPILTATVAIATRSTKALDTVRAH